ncbi:MAG: hypothetical protein ACRDPY_44270 [Streptosporangiaceae bacterium]
MTASPGAARDAELGRLVMAAKPRSFWLDQPDVPAARAPMARADGRSGRRNLWLRALDAAGMGFDS